MSAINKCRKCGKEVGVITWGIYRKVLVDMEVFMVTADPDGEIFVRIDGSKLRGKVSTEELPEHAEPAYRPHRCRGGRDDL